MGADSARGRCAGGCGSSEPAAVWPLPEPVALQVVQRAVSGADLRNVPLDRLLALSQESHGLRPLYRTGSDRRGGCPGLGGFKGFTALGDATNVAARLTAQASAGEILMDARTYDAVTAQHPDAERRELELKGKSAPVEAFAVQVR